MSNWEPTPGEMINTPMGIREFLALSSEETYICWTPRKTNTGVYPSHLCSEIKPEPIIERRWIWLRDVAEGHTVSTASYFSAAYANINYAKLDGWYRSEHYIDVDVSHD